MTIKITAFLNALLVGGWMIFDGIHVLTTGKYLGPEKPGLWSDVISYAGLDPFSLGFPFIALGSLWLLFLAAMLFHQQWGWYGALLIAILTLWYLPVGTAFSVMYIVLLVVFRSRLQM
jgi:hypothetical protein